MATKRRSTRNRNVPSKYFKESSSEDDEADDDQTKAAKQKLKQMVNEDSEAESDFEVEKDAAEESDDQEEEDEEDEEGMEEDDEVKKQLSMNISSSESKSFCLSESDSSDDEAGESPPNSSKMVNAIDNIFLRQTQDDSEKDNLESSQKLMALAGNLEKINEVWQETSEGEDKKITPKKEKGKSKKRKSLDTFETVKKPRNIDNGDGASDSIGKLLERGEGVKDEGPLSSDEDVKEPVLPSNGVEITVPVPEHMRRRKKKSFDLEAHLKRLLSKEQREFALLLHEANLVCLCAHILHLNSVCSDPSLLCQALSLVPRNHAHTAETVTLTRLSHLLAWLRETVPVNKHASGNVSIKDMVTRLENGLSTLLVMCNMELVLVFTLMTRALGYDTRIVMNLNIPSKTDTSIFNAQPSSLLAATKTKTEDKVKTKSKGRKRSKKNESDDEEEEEVKPSKSKSRGKVKEKEKGSEEKKGTSKSKSSSKEEKSTKSISSKLAAAAAARKSKTLNPSVSEENLIKSIKKKTDSKEETKSRRNTSKNEVSPKKEESPGPSRGKQSKKSEVKDNKEMYYWVEVYLQKEKKWIPVDVLTGKVNNPSDIESRVPKPVMYVFAVNSGGRIKDVTMKYCSNFLTSSKKLRIDQKWLDKTLRPYLDTDNDKEDREMIKKSEEAPLPTSVAQFKGHPMYVLQRHLLKFEAIYPSDAPTLGFIKGEPVYARECVHILNGRTAWLKEGRVVKIGEEPYKIVKARPKWDKMSGCKKSDEPLDLFGHWQTELYKPKPAENGIVPRNEYGNVELFKPWMLPEGTIHIEINGLASVIRKTGIDAAPAMMGWDFSGTFARPVLQGYVVCKENVDALMDAWNQEQEIKAQREHEKREKRVLGNWKRLVKGLVFREKMRLKYMDD